MQKKSYKITASLREGFTGEGQIHTLEETEEIIETWFESRIAENLPTVSGMLQDGKLFFPSKGERADGSPVTICRTVIYFGELSSESDMKREDTEVTDTLESLARALKADLGQEEVYIIFNEHNWAV